MSKEITVDLSGHPRNVAPTRECVEKALKGKKLLRLSEVRLGESGWQAIVEVEAAKVKPKPALKQVAKPAVKPKAAAKKPSLGKKKDSE